MVAIPGRCTITPVGGGVYGIAAQKACSTPSRKPFEPVRSLGRGRLRRSSTGSSCRGPRRWPVLRLRLGEWSASVRGAG